MTSQIEPPGSHYTLGYSETERTRLMRQAVLLAPITKHRLHEAGLGTGQRVMDIGSGAGDVSMIAARLVGTAGSVVGIEREPSMLALARERVRAVALDNVTFIDGELQRVEFEQLFDAVVGRLVLNHLGRPIQSVHSIAKVVRPGGLVLFQEGTWTTTLAIGAGFPLWSCMLRTIREAMVRSGLDPDLGLNLPQIFEDAGLPRPTMHLEMPLADDGSITELQFELFQTLHPVAQRLRVDLTDLGDLDTLADRLDAERQQMRAVVGFLGIVTAWCRIPI